MPPQRRSPLFITTGLVILTLAVWQLSLTPPLSTRVVNQQPACSLTLAEQIAQADVILTGRVAMIIPGAPGQARVIIRPDHVYRGAISAATVTVLAVDDLNQPSAGPTMLHLTSHDPPYLFYLRRVADDLYTTSRCQGTRLLGMGPSPLETASFPSLVNR